MQILKTFLVFFVIILPHFVSGQNESVGGYTCNDAIDVECNHIPNPQFIIGTPTNQEIGAFISSPSIPKHVYNWNGSVGSADINGALSSNPVTIPTFLGNNVNFATMVSQQIIRDAYFDIDGIFHPAFNEALTEGISAKIKSVEKDKEYALSFFIDSKVQNPFTTSNFQPLHNFKFKIILAKCESFPEYGEGANYPGDYLSPPSYPSEYQTIYCESIDFGDFDWRQCFIKFKATDDFDIIWIFPEPSASLNNIEGDYSSSFNFAYPELISLENFSAGNTPPIDDDCNVVLEPQGCSIMNGLFTWLDPIGNIIYQGNSITSLNVNRSNSGYYTLTLSAPFASFTGINCSEDLSNPFINPILESKVYVAPTSNCGDLLLNGIALYDRYSCSDGYIADFTEDLNLFDFNNLCFNTNERLYFKFESNIVDDNNWTYNILTPNSNIVFYDPNTLLPLPAPGTIFSTNQSTEMLLTLEPSQVCEIEIVLNNTVYNESKSIRIRVNSVNDLNSQYCECNYLRFKKREKNNISLYPNPVSSVLNVSLKENADKILVYNLNGIVLKTVPVFNTNTKIDFSNFLSGIYMLEFQYNGKIISKEMVIKK